MQCIKQCLPCLCHLGHSLILESPSLLFFIPVCLSRFIPGIPFAVTSSLIGLLCSQSWVGVPLVLLLGDLLALCWPFCRYFYIYYSYWHFSFQILFWKLSNPAKLQYWCHEYACILQVDLSSRVICSYTLFSQIQREITCTLSPLFASQPLLRSFCPWFNHTQQLFKDSFLDLFIQQVLIK